MFEISENLVGIVAIITTVGLPIALGMYLGIKSSKQKHIERMELIKQGIMPEYENNTPPNRLKQLRNGLLLGGVGIGLGLSFTIIYANGLDEDEFGWLVGTLILIFMSIGYLVYYAISKKEDAKNEIE
ncbi:MAG: hypothetical protein M9897_05500 [Brumimicrobium sp.]|nr:hypothetical protein [Brumimicrobium sp.]